MYPHLQTYFNFKSLWQLVLANSADLKVKVQTVCVQDVWRLQILAKAFSLIFNIKK